MKTRVEQFHQYCINTGMPDTVHGFALWNAWQDIKDELAEKDRKIEELVAEVERMHLKVGKRLQDENFELTRKNAELEADNARMREALQALIDYKVYSANWINEIPELRRRAIAATSTPASDWLEQQKMEVVANVLEELLGCTGAPVEAIATAMLNNIRAQQKGDK